MEGVGPGRYRDANGMDLLDPPLPKEAGLLFAGKNRAPFPAKESVLGSTKKLCTKEVDPQLKLMICFRYIKNPDKEIYEGMSLTCK